MSVNDGKGNVCAGREGAVAVRATAEAEANALGCVPEVVFVASNGIIGGRLRYERIIEALPSMS